MRTLQDGNRPPPISFLMQTMSLGHLPAGFPPSGWSVLSTPCSKRICRASAVIVLLSLEGEALTERMSKENPMNPGQQHRKAGKAQPPEWADGLKRLYDSVLDEPLPDSFAQLLDKLDDPSNG